MNWRQLITIVLGFCVSACVTVNVYFPASAAERAADQFIKDVYGQEAGGQGDGDATGDVPQSWRAPERQQIDSLLAQALAFFVANAHAQQPDINISSPAIRTLKGAMEQRHRRLRPFYNSGAVGMSGNGLIVLRDAKQVPLKQRNEVKKMVADENRDRNRLYKEIATANGHPEWEPDIRGIFAARWVGNAPGGWWYQRNGKWQQK